MSKKNYSFKEQRQFLFVFNNLNAPVAVGELPRSEHQESPSKALSDEQHRVHREQLIADLQEFGC